MRRKLTIAFLIVLGLASCSAKKSSAVVQPQRERVANSFSPNERAEFFWVKPLGEGPFPMIVFLHGHQEPRANRVGGKVFADWGTLGDYAQAGFVALSVSQPGYGGSEGKPDFCGPRTQAAVATVIDHFRATKFVDSSRIAIEGISRGAVVASMIAARDANLRAVVLIAGVYDLKAFYNERCAGSSNPPIAESICQSIRDEMPINDDGFAKRSALDHVTKVKARVLILHGADDQNSPVGQAQAFAEALREAGVEVDLHVFSGVDHRIPLSKRQPIVNAFLKRSLGITQDLPQ